MQNRIVWQQESSSPSSANDFAAISQWWSGLAGQEITWRQRLVPESGNLSDLDWEPQRFDETVVMQSPNVRGITLYWRSPHLPDERSTTPYKLELDPIYQQLFIYPQTQRGIVIRVALPQVEYQKITIAQPQIAIRQLSGRSVLTIRDESQLLEVAVNLSPEAITILSEALQSTH